MKLDIESSGYGWTGAKAQEEIGKAVWELLQKKTIEDISVHEICEAAKVSRQSFYRYYPDKYEVVNGILESLTAMFLMKEKVDFKDYIAYYSELFMSKQTFLKNALSYVGQNSTRKRFEYLQTVAIKKVFIDGGFERELTPEIETGLSFFVAGSAHLMYSAMERGEIQPFNYQNMIKYVPQILVNYFA